MARNYDTADVEKTQAPIDWRLRKNEQAYEAGGAISSAERLLTRKEIIDQLFSYHPPTEETVTKYAAINQAAKNFAEVVSQNCPNGADLSAAIRLIREARMTANAAVALNGLSL